MVLISFCASRILELMQIIMSFCTCRLLTIIDYNRLLPCCNVHFRRIQSQIHSTPLPTYSLTHCTISGYDLWMMLVQAWPLTSSKDVQLQVFVLKEIVHFWNIIHDILRLSDVWNKIHICKTVIFLQDLFILVLLFFFRDNFKRFTIHFIHVYKKLRCLAIVLKKIFLEKQVNKIKKTDSCRFVE